MLFCFLVAVFMKTHPENFNCAGGWHEERWDHSHGCTFPWTVWTEETKHIAAVDSNI